MRIIRLLTLCSAAVLAAGCNTVPQTSAPSRMAAADYAQREPIATSLFPADQALLSDEAVARILSSKLELPAKAKLALMRFPDSGGSHYYGPYYWRDEQFVKLQQSQIESLSQALATSDQIAEVTPLPSLMTPSKISLPILREAAVRMQADLLLVFRVSSDTYSQYRVFSKDQAKAYSTCELVLLDVRTGLVPFARVVSRERLEQKQSSDFDLSETMRRAEQAAAADALKAAADELVTYVKAVPKKGA